MNARPTVLSIILGIVALALSGPMVLLSTVDDVTCTAPDGDGQRSCSSQLTDGDFWQRTAASGIGSVADAWQPLMALLLPMFGVPVLLDVVRKGSSSKANGGEDSASAPGLRPPPSA